MPGKFTWRGRTLLWLPLNLFPVIQGDVQVFHLCQETSLRHPVAFIQKCDPVNAKKSTNTCDTDAYCSCRRKCGCFVVRIRCFYVQCVWFVLCVCLCLRGKKKLETERKWRCCNSLMCLDFVAEGRRTARLCFGVCFHHLCQKSDFSQITRFKTRLERASESLLSSSVETEHKWHLVDSSSTAPRLTFKVHSREAVRGLASLFLSDLTWAIDPISRSILPPFFLRFFFFFF